MEAATVVVHRDGRVLELRRTITNRQVTVTYPGPQGPTGRIDVKVVNFALRTGADRTGATASDAALATLITEAAAAVTAAAGPLVVEFPPGTYRFDTAKTYDPEKITLVAPGGPYLTTIDNTHMTTGTAWTIAKATTSNHPSVPMEGFLIQGPTAASAVDCFGLGGTGVAANQVKFLNCSVNGFRDQIVMGHNTWCATFERCNMRASTRTMFSAPSSATTAGEGIRFIDCTIHGHAVETFNIAGTATTVACIGCSIDYNARAALITDGSLTLESCWLETGDATTGAEMFNLAVGGTYNPSLHIRNTTLVPLWSTAGSCKTMVRITGAAGTTNNRSLVDIDGLHVINGSVNTGVNALVIDESTASSSVAASKFSSVSVRGISYKDAGGSHGVYHPFYVQDRSSRKLLISTGIDYGDLTYQGLARMGEGAVTHIYESIPHHRAIDLFQMTSGDTYLVRLPISDLGGFRATAFDLMMAIGAVGASMTVNHIGLYDLGNESALATTFTRIGSVALTLTTGADSIKSGNIVATVSAGYPRNNLYAGIALTGTTIPHVYGSKAAAASPLLDPAGTVFPYPKAVRYTGGVGLPGTLTLASGLKADFIPWAAVKPTAYV